MAEETTAQKIQSRARAIVRTGTVWARSGVTRLGIYTIALIALVALLYFRVWIPLTTEVPLPPGVSRENPSLDVTLLRSINEARALRTTRTPAEFRVNSFFTNEPSPL